MAESRAREKAKDRHRTVTASLAGEDQLTQRAAAQQHAGKAREHHAEEVPETVCVRNRLVGKTEMEVACAGGAAENEVADQSANQNRRKAENELRLLEENQVPDAADHAKTRSLRQCADDKTSCEADKNGRVHRAGAISGFCKVDECRGRKQQRQNCERQDGEHAALRLRERIAPFEGVALIEEEHAD